LPNEQILGIGYSPVLSYCEADFGNEVRRGLPESESESEVAAPGPGSGPGPGPHCQ